MVNAATQDDKRIWRVLETVTDPEVPVLTVVDLGIVRDIKPIGENGVEVTITPTYSGCPAMNMIEMNIRIALMEAGYEPVEVKTVLSPAWTTDWLSEAGKRKLKEYGIAPPQGSVNKGSLLEDFRVVPCPHCDSTDTEMISQFGSTPCKSLFKCKECLEPFDYFKCH
jgi:ring-1,2-phenylacetyl-CoA epoxidase subunit PaaD